MRSLSSVRYTPARILAAGSLIASLMFSAVLPAQAAGWQDPLVTPAMKSLLAHESLLLDVTSAGSRLVAVGERGHIIFSDDDGFTWVQSQQVPVISTLTSVYFVDENHGWAIGHDGVVLHSQNSGLTWVKQFDGFKANEMVLQQAKEDKKKYEKELNKAKVMGVARRISQIEAKLENATYALEDAQVDFEEKSTKPLLDLWFKSPMEGFVIGAYGMIFKTFDGGQTWQDWSSHVDNPDRFHLNSIVNIGAGKLMIVGEAGLMLRTFDDGGVWEKMFSPYEGSFFGVSSLNKQGIQLAYGLRGNIARTDDFGSSWRLMDSGTEQSLMGATDRYGRILFVVGNGGAFVKGIDMGRKWENSVRKGRSGAASVLLTTSGHFVVVGEGGVELLDKAGERLAEPVKSVKG